MDLISEANRGVEQTTVTQKSTQVWPTLTDWTLGDVAAILEV